MPKQSKLPILVTDKLCGFHTEAISSGLWENVELSKNKMSTYQDATIMAVVLGQGCNGVKGMKGVHYHEGEKGPYLPMKNLLCPFVVWDMCGVPIVGEGWR